MKNIPTLITILGLQLLFSTAFSTAGYTSDEIFEQVDPATHHGDYTGDFDKTIWQEGDTVFPDLPDESDLITFSGASAYPQYRYAIDGKTLSIGKDEIVRFTIVISSPQGSKNSYYQGLNCAKRNIKSYAYAASTSEKFIGYASPQWKGITNRGSMGYSENLADFYFCNTLGIVMKKNQILSNLKYANNEGQFGGDAY